MKIFKHLWSFLFFLSSIYAFDFWPLVNAAGIVTIVGLCSWNIAREPGPYFASFQAPESAALPPIYTAHLLPSVTIVEPPQPTPTSQPPQPTCTAINDPALHPDFGFDSFYSTPHPDSYNICIPEPSYYEQTSKNVEYNALSAVLDFVRRCYMSFGCLQGKKYLHEWWLVGALLLIGCGVWHQRNRLARFARGLDVQGAWQRNWPAFINFMTACCYLVSDWSCVVGHCLKTAVITCIRSACCWCCEFGKARFEDARVGTVGFSQWIADLRAPHRQSNPKDLATMDKFRVDLGRTNQKVDAYRGGCTVEHGRVLEQLQDLSLDHKSLHASFDLLKAQNKVPQDDAHANSIIARQTREDLDEIMPRYRERNRQDYAKTVKIIAESQFMKQLGVLEDKFNRRMADFEKQPQQEVISVQPSQQDTQKLIQQEVKRQAQDIRKEAQQEIQRQIPIIEKRVRLDVQKKMEQQLEQKQPQLPQQLQHDPRRIDRLEADIVSMRGQVNAPIVPDVKMDERLQLAEDRLVNAADKVDLAELKQDIETEIADVRSLFNTFYYQDYLQLYSVVGSVTRQTRFDWNQYQAEQNAAQAQHTAPPAAAAPEESSQETATSADSLSVSGPNVDNARAVTENLGTGIVQQPSTQAPGMTDTESVQTVEATTPLQASNSQRAATRGVHYNDLWSYELFKSSFPDGKAAIIETSDEERKCGFYAFIESMYEQVDVGVTFDEMAKAFMCPEVHGVMCEQWGLDNVNDFNADQIAATARNWALQNLPDADNQLAAADVYIGFVADEVPGAIAVFSPDDVSGPIPEGRQRWIVWLHNNNKKDILQRQGASAEQTDRTHSHWSGLARPSKLGGRTNRRQIKVSPPDTAPVTPKRSVHFALPLAENQPDAAPATPTAPVTPSSDNATGEQDQHALQSENESPILATQAAGSLQSELNTDAMDIEVGCPADEGAMAEQWQNSAPQVPLIQVPPVDEEIQDHIEDLQRRHGEYHRIAEANAEKDRADRRAEKKEREAEKAQRLALQETERLADEESRRLQEDQACAEAADRRRREQENDVAAEAQRIAEEQEQQRRAQEHEQEQRRLAHEQEEQRQAQVLQQQRQARAQEQEQERQRQVGEQERQRHLQEQQPEQTVEQQPVASQTVAAKPSTEPQEVATHQPVQQETVEQHDGQENNSDQQRQPCPIAEECFVELFPSGAVKLRVDGAEGSSVRAVNAVISSMAHQYPNARRPTVDELFCSLGERNASMMRGIGRGLPTNTLAQMITNWSKKFDLDFRLGVQDSNDSCVILPEERREGRIVWVHTSSLEKMGMCCGLRYGYPVTSLLQEQNGDQFFKQAFPHGSQQMINKSSGRSQAFTALIDSVEAQQNAEITLEEVEAIYEGLGITAGKWVPEDHLAEILMTWARVYHSDADMYLGILQDDPDARWIYLPEDVKKPKKFVFVRLGSSGYSGLKRPVKGLRKSHLGSAKQKVSTTSTQGHGEAKNHNKGTNDTDPSSHESTAAHSEKEEKNGRTSARQISLRTREKEGKPPAAEKLPHAETCIKEPASQPVMSNPSTFDPSKFKSFKFESEDPESEASEDESRGNRTAKNSLALSRGPVPSRAKPSYTAQPALIPPADQSAFSFRRRQPPAAGPEQSFAPSATSSGGGFNFSAASDPSTAANPFNTTSISGGLQHSGSTKANVSTSFNTGLFAFNDMTGTQAAPGSETPYSSPPPPPPTTQNQGLDPAERHESTATLAMAHVAKAHELDRQWKAENGVRTTDASVSVQPEGTGQQYPNQYGQTTNADVDENGMELDTLEMEVERDQAQ